MDQNTVRVLKGIGSLVFLLVMAVIVAQKIDAIIRMSTIGWIVLMVVFVGATFCSIKLMDLAKTYIRIKESTLEWLSISICFMIVGVAAYFLNTQSINNIIFLDSKKEASTASKPLIDYYNSNDIANFKVLLKSNKRDIDIKIGSHTLLTRSILDKKYNYALVLIKSGANINAYQKRLTIEESDKLYKLRDVPCMSKDMHDNLVQERKTIMDNASSGYISYPPIYYAIKQDAIEVVKALLQSGVNLSGISKMKVGDTPVLNYARKQKYTEVFNLVFEKYIIK